MIFKKLGIGICLIIYVCVNMYWYMHLVNMSLTDALKFIKFGKMAAHFMLNLVWFIEKCDKYTHNGTGIMV